MPLCAHEAEVLQRSSKMVTFFFGKTSGLHPWSLTWPAVGKHHLQVLSYTFGGVNSDSQDRYQN